MPSRKCSTLPARLSPQGWSGLIALGVLVFAATGFVGSRP
jgi:hypothetical protein